MLTLTLMMFEIPPSTVENVRQYRGTDFWTFWISKCFVCVQEIYVLYRSTEIEKDRRGGTDFYFRSLCIACTLSFALYTSIALGLG